MRVNASAPLEQTHRLGSSRPRAWARIRARRLSAAVLLAAASLCAATALAQTEVPNNWPLIPSGLGAGDQFRLMLVVEELKDATATGLGTYDSFVRGEISANRHTSIRAYSSSFRVLGSTNTVNARDHTGTTARPSWSTGRSWPRTGFLRWHWTTVLGQIFEDGTMQPATRINCFLFHGRNDGRTT